MASTSTQRPYPEQSSRTAKAKTTTDILDQDGFHRIISLERKRSERSQRPFALLLMEVGSTMPVEKRIRLLGKLLSALAFATRETDVLGWYEATSAAGVIFTEITLDNNLVLSTILSRLSGVLCEHLTSDQLSKVKFSFHIYPDQWSPNDPGRPGSPELYPDLQQQMGNNRVNRTIKRGMDILGSLLLLLVLSPVFFLIAIAIRLSSKGPVFFRQERIGEHGIPFTFLKFRSMYVDNDESQHKEYVRQLIAGQALKQTTDLDREGVFKLANDPRITAVGNLLRRTSLDELPQFINVLRGEMSLVGPRPPVPYEVEAYAPWHRRRLLEAKPGITGLWQIHGRSRVGFDDMVRLDLRYARYSSPWLDVKILLQTPKAVLAGTGAY